MKPELIEVTDDKVLDDFSQKLSAIPTIAYKRKKKSKKKWIALLLFLLIGGTAALGKMRAKPPMEFAQASEERTGPITRSFLRVGGYVNFDRVVDIGTTEAGPVEELLLVEGKYFRKGDVLAVMRNREILIDQKILENKLQDSRREYDRMQKLIQNGIAVQADFDRAGTALRQCELDLESVSAKLKNTYILAPFDGVVVEKYVEVGGLVEGRLNGEPLGRVARFGDPSVMVVEIDVNQNDIQKIAPQQSAIVTLDAFPGIEYAAKLLRIYPRGDKAKNTVPVKVKVLQPDDHFHAQMSAKVLFVNEPVIRNNVAKSNIVVPEMAIEQQDDQYFVWKKDSEQLKKVKVEIGDVQENGVILIAGVQPNDQLLLDPEKHASKDGSQVAKKGSFNIFEFIHH